MTTISLGELTHGAHRSARATENLARIEVLLSTLILLPFDAPSARRFGALKAELERTGVRVSDLDLQIASIAIENAAPLVTHNHQHFERVPGLQLEDWMVV